MRMHAIHFGTFRHLFAPRKPRHPLVRVAAGIVGLAILAVLAFFGLFVGAAMLAVGLTWKLLARPSRRAAASAPGRVVDGEYRVVERPSLPLSR